MVREEVKAYPKSKKYQLQDQTLTYILRSPSLAGPTHVIHICMYSESKFQ